MRLIVAICLTSLMTTIVVLVGAAPARACSCSASEGIDEEVAQALDWVKKNDGFFFIGEQVAGGQAAAGDVFDIATPLTFRVDQVIAGDPTLISPTFLGHSMPDVGCGGGPYGDFSGNKAYIAAFKPEMDELLANGDGPRRRCIRARFVVGMGVWLATVGPRGANPPGRSSPTHHTRPPAFIVSHRLGDSHLAALDSSGAVVAYADNPDQSVVRIETCPGGDVVVAAVIPNEDPEAQQAGQTQPPPSPSRSVRSPTSPC